MVSSVQVVEPYPFSKMIVRDGALGLRIDTSMEYIYSERYYPNQDELAAIKASIKLGKMLMMVRTDANKQG